jgi:hypothetical protein
MDDPLCTCVFICNDHRSSFFSLSINNPEISLSTKDNFIWNRYFPCFVSHGVLYILNEKI